MCCALLNRFCDNFYLTILNWENEIFAKVKKFF